MIVCIIQARVGSTRLPGKVLKLILGKPMLLHQIERVKRSRVIDKIIIATTTKNEDDPIESLAVKAGVFCFRGSEHDVLDRYYQAAKGAQADIVIRLTGDCPMSDPVVIDETVEYFMNQYGEIDYTSKPTNYPEGLDVEVFSFDALSWAWNDGVKPSEREHVTPYMYNHPEIFNLGIWGSGTDDFSKMHWSVDTAEDFMFITKIFETLYPSNNFFSKEDILTLLQEQPEFFLTPKSGTGYEGYVKSLKEDEEFQKKKDIYEKIIGFEPDAIFLFSAGTVREIGEDGLITYRSTKKNEGDAFGILWGEARVLATAELLMHFSKAIVVTTSFRAPNEPSHAEIIRDELKNISIDSNRIFLEEKSKDTLSQIGESLKLIVNKKWQKVAIVTNEYHIPRVTAMYEHFQDLVPQDEEAVDTIITARSLGIEIVFVAAESILPYHDKKFTAIIENVKKSQEYRKRLLNEKRGLEMVLSGEYGRYQVSNKDKYEGEVY